MSVSIWEVPAESLKSGISLGFSGTKDGRVLGLCESDGSTVDTCNALYTCHSGNLIYI